MRAPALLTKEGKGLVETSLGNPQGSFEVQDHRLVSEDVAGRLRSGGPPEVDGPESLLGVRQISGHPSRVAEIAPGESPELVGPPGLRGLIVRQGLGHENGDLRHHDGACGVLRRHLLAPPGDQLGEPPARKRPVAPQQGETILMGGQRIEAFPESRRLRPRACQRRVDHSEPQRQSAGPIEIEKPAAGPAALGTDGDLVEEAPVLSLRAVQGQQFLQRLGGQVLVLHLRSPPSGNEISLTR
jgi:hypothetical protein